DKMPKATTTDISLTKSYIPKVSKILGISPIIAQFYKPIENRNIHEGCVVNQAYYKSNNIERLFTNIRFNCLFQINEPIVPRFILDFYSQVTVQTDEYGYLVISFMIQHEFITLTLAQFGQILKIPYNGQAVFTNEWDLASLEYSRETEGPYCTDLPTPDDIRRLLELERVMVDRTIKSQTVSLNPNQILTKELSPDMKQWEELIRENVFGLGGHRDHLPACLAHMLYCVVAEEQYNLAYFFVKRIQCARATPTANLPYGMFLTRLYRHVMETYPHLDNGIYDIVDRVIRTSSHQYDDDDDDDVETSCASTPSPTTYLNSFGPLNYQNYQMPSASEQTDKTLFERQTTLLNQTSVFGVKGVDLGKEEAPYWTTLGKMEYYKPRPSSDGVGTQTPYYARKDFVYCHLLGEWEISKDAELNPFKDTLVFRRMDKPPKNGDGAWHAKIRLIDPDGKEFTKTLQSIPTTRKLSERESPREIIDLDHFYDA
ncbi:hypothetical protein Tco_0906540, partial [Tanacetum coccineum]